MKMLSIKGRLVDKAAMITQLEADGVVIFRSFEYDQLMIGAKTHCRIIFNVPDEETETALRLKYPPGYLEEHDA
jgi:hypothetical protein